jgi:hypothetical protein
MPRFTPALSFDMRPDAKGWTWSTITPEGHRWSAGRGPSRAMAAAMIIRSICEACLADQGEADRRTSLPKAA